MKRNNLTTAVVAGIAGVAGIASVSNAVNLNSDGVGQVLVYPYYTVNNGLNTLISVVNTSDRTKAVKVRFLEGKNSRECLDFNLYLSPYDVWTAGLVAATATSLYSPGFEGEDTVKIVTSDQSCTDPSALSGYEFLPWAFVGTAADPVYNPGGWGLERCTEGHFEMIEMGNIADATTEWGIIHDDGTPNDCGVLTDNWSGAGSLDWANDENDGLEAPTGGLFGSASIIDVTGGTDVAYNADAIEGVFLAPAHTDPGNLQPGLGDGDDNNSYIFANAAVVSDFWMSNPVQAVSAVYMHDQIFGEYVLSDGIGANTEWVVTFPTKNYYVDPARTPFAFVPYEPFEESIGEYGACEVYTIALYDREERTPDPRLVIRPPSPRPPTVTNDDAVFCWETNVLEFEDSDRASGDSVILGSRNTTHYATQSVPAQPATPQTPAVEAEYFTTGWVALSFAQSTDDNLNGRTYGGLPVTGFAIQRYVNQNASEGVLANYAGLFAHRYSRDIVSN